MMIFTRRAGWAAGLLVAFGLASACDPGAPVAPTDQAPNLAVTIPATGLNEKVWVCNDDAAGISLDFTVTGTGITIVDPAPTIGPGNCTLVAADGAGNNVTVTQTLVPGYDFVRIDPFYILLNTTNLVPEASVSVPTITRSFGDRGWVFVFFNELTPGGGEGCTPGFWKNRGYRLGWPTYDPYADYATTFGVPSSFTATLLEALDQGGGGEYALGRHAVAALLNAASPDVDYDYSEAEVIAAVQDAYATGDFEGTKDDFEGYNEQEALGFCD